MSPSVTRVLMGAHVSLTSLIHADLALHEIGSAISYILTGFVALFPEKAAAEKDEIIVRLCAMARIICRSDNDREYLLSIAGTTSGSAYESRITDLSNEMLKVRP